MKRSILIVAPYLPLPADFGGALRIYHLIRHLSGEHDVSLLAPGSAANFVEARTLGELCDVTLVPSESTARQPAGQKKRLAQLGSMVSGRSYLEAGTYNPAMQAVLTRLLNTRPVDLVQFEFPESALYEVPSHIPTIFDAHNVEYELLERVAHSSRSSAQQIFNQLEARKLRRLECAVWSRTTLCVATSERDAQTIRQAVSTPVDVAPNGVDLDFFAEMPFSSSQPGHVVFTGAIRHQPNADGAHWYVENVHPIVQREIPNTTFTIAGADPPPGVQALASASVTVTGWVDDIRPFLRRAQVVAVPLWSGGGTRLKILEAFAAGRPVVSTSIGAEGIDAEHGRHLLIADTAAGFAAAVARLSRDEDLSRALTTNARSLVEDRYGWQAIAHQLMDSHERATALHQS